MKRTAQTRTAFAERLLVTGIAAAVIVGSPAWLVTACGAANAATAEEPPSRTDMLQEARRLSERYFDATVPQVEQESILSRLREIGENLSQSGHIGSSEIFRFVGHKLYRSGDYSEAMSLFDHVASQPDTLQDRVDSLRMIAQIHSAWGVRSSAAAAYRELMTAVQQSDQMWRLYPQFTNAAQMLAHLQSMDGHYEQSVATRSLVLTTPDVQVSHDERLLIYLNNGRDCTRARNFTDAVSWYDRIINEYPQYGWDTGDIVTLLAERIEAHGFDRDSDLRLVQLQVLWRDARLRQFPQSLTVGHQLAELLRSRSDMEPEATRVLEEVAARADELWPQLNTQQRARYEHVRAHTLFLLALRAERLGNTEAAADLYVRLLTEHPNHQYATWAHRNHERLYDTD